MTRAPAGCSVQFVARLDDPVVEPLMVSFRMIMGNEFLGSGSERPFAEQDHAVKTLLFYGSDEAFEM